jgi:hypothetical protein
MGALPLLLLAVVSLAAMLAAVLLVLPQPQPARTQVDPEQG